MHGVVSVWRVRVRGLRPALGRHRHAGPVQCVIRTAVKAGGVAMPYPLRVFKIKGAVAQVGR